MLAGLIIAMRVIVAPNSAFAHVRDNDGKWLAWSAVIYVLVSLALVSLTPHYAFVTEGMQEPDGGLQAAERTQSQMLDLGTVSVYAVAVLLTGCIPPALIYLLGRLLGGNKSWQKVFAGVFYTHAVLIPLLAITPILLLVMHGRLDTIFGVVQISEYDIPLWAEIILLAAIILVAIVWSIAVLAKAVRIINGFGLGKSLGIIALVYLATSVVAISSNM